MKNLPMWEIRQVCKVFVTIEYKGGGVDLKLWKGRNKKRIQEAARRFYPSDAKLRFGNQFYVSVV